VSQAATPSVLAEHMPEYLIEAACLGLFMVSAGLVTTLFEYPGSWLRQLIGTAAVRRALEGLAMGLTAIALIYSPWGRRSGAHMNPAVTLAFLSLNKVRRIDALGYIVAQFCGALLGVLTVQAALHEAFTGAPVSWAMTHPHRGVALALAAELLISAVMMYTVLTLAVSRQWARYTGLAAGALVAIYITLEAPLSGMSMNPARSFASAAPPGAWRDLWIYFLAPVLGMQLAALLHRLRTNGAGCAKLIHSRHERCIHCGHRPLARGTRA